MILLFNAAAFIGLTIAIILAATGRRLDHTTEQGRALGVGVIGMWLTSIVGLLRRANSPVADDAALIAWAIWAVIAGWLVTELAKRHR